MPDGRCTRSNFSNLFKTKIVYEAYPEKQAEVDEMITRLRLNIKVIYDP